MALALETLVKQLSDSGIISSGKLENFVPPKANPTSIEELLRELHKQNLLTKFQAQQVAAGRIKSLILGGYTILDKIGAGGMGQVFKAQHRRMDRFVAIKVLPPAMTKDAAAVARFEREVRAAAKLEHPNIVTAHDADQANGIHFLVMQYVEGSDLSATVKENGPLSVGKAVNYILQAARGLEYAHKHGVIHRDIKPANLLLDKEGTVKILDMGLARIEADGNTATQAELTGTGAVMGTVDYMSPEQARNTHNADARADIYSLGCSLFYLLSGKPLYGGDTITNKLIAHQFDPIPLFRDVRNDVPEELEAIFTKMVAKKIDERFQSMTEVISALQVWCGSGGSSDGTYIFTNTQIASDAAGSNSNLSFLKEMPSPTILRTTNKQTHALKPTPSVAANKSKNLPLIGIGVFGIVLIVAGIIVSLRTSDGTLIVEVDQPEAMVQVLDAEGKVEVSHKGGVGKVTVSVDPGKHRLKVEKDGFEVFAKDFEIVAKGNLTMRAKLIPVQTIPELPNSPSNTPSVQKWVKDVQALPAEQQVKAVMKKLMELNPKFDGNETHKIVNNVVTELSFLSDEVRDISPLRAFAGLETLICNGSIKGKRTLADLSPLQGMRLKKLTIHYTSIADLSPLTGMPLTHLNCSVTPLSDLSALKGMPLTSLTCSGTKVTDVRPLRGLPLTVLHLLGSSISDISPLEQCRDLETLVVTRTKVTPASVNALHNVLPNCKIEWDDPALVPAATATAPPTMSTKLFMHDPAFPQWMAQVQAMPAQEQVKAVSKKLMELNPGFDGKLTAASGIGLPSINDGVITSIGFDPAFITDISPLRLLSGLKSLACNGKQTTTTKRNPLCDLSPLRGMQLSSLLCSFTEVADLSPLKGMPLKTLRLERTNVTHLSPLQGMSLNDIRFSGTLVSDLSPLIGMPLTSLYCNHTPIRDVTPLKECSTLRTLFIFSTSVTPIDVAALQQALPDCKIEWDDPAKMTKPQPAASGSK